jgi:hypothetical protein
MHAYHKDTFIYICIPKNGSTTFSTLLSKNGWNEIDLTQTDLDLSKHILWGHITNPERRHTKGLAQFLKINPDIDINNETVAKLVVTGVFDAHTASISQILGSFFYLPIRWIPLDAKINNYYNDIHTIVNGNDLTNDFFIQNGIPIRITEEDVKHRESEQTPENKTSQLRDQIEELKKKWYTNNGRFSTGYRQSVETFLKEDIELYAAVMKDFNRQYLKKPRTWLN